MLQTPERYVAWTMTKVMTFIALVLVVGGLAYHFAALKIFNTLVPKDAGSWQAAADLHYGPDARQTLDIYKPTSGEGPWPIVVFVHGGSWQEGNKNGYEFAGRAIASQGFLTLVMNYRLHPQSRYPAFIEDVARALRWAADNGGMYGGNSQKLFAMGHSAGAYNVAMAVLDESMAPNRPKLSGVVSLAGPFDFLPLDTAATIKVFGEIADLAATQPINHASKTAPPFLMLHGASDTTVFPRNASALDAALKRAGSASLLKIYPGVSHVGIMLSLAKPFRSTPVLEDAVEFFRDKSR